MVSATTLMQQKTLAKWVAYDRITELRITDEYPEVGEFEGEIGIDQINWRYVPANLGELPATTYGKSLCGLHPKAIRRPIWVW